MIVGVTYIATNCDLLLYPLLAPAFVAPSPSMFGLEISRYKYKNSFKSAGLFECWKSDLGLWNIAIFIVFVLPRHIQFLQYADDCIVSVAGIIVSELQVTCSELELYFHGLGLNVSPGCTY